jgi:TRAP-type C4-dicarboxylate transport system permease small subunit
MTDRASVNADSAESQALVAAGSSGSSDAVSFVSGCVIAAFMGIIVYFMTRNFDINSNVAYAAAGISGWLGPRVLDEIAAVVIKMAGLGLDKK